MSIEDQVKQIFDNFWKWRVQRSPEFASLAGLKDYDDSLETYTTTRFEEDYHACQQFLQQAQGFDKDLDQLTPQTKQSLKLFKAEVLTFIDGYKYFGFFHPINNIEGIQVDFSRLAEWMTLDAVEDYDNLLKRFNKFPILAEQICQILRTAINEKRTNHHYTMFAVLDQFNSHAGDPKKTDFWEPFQKIPNQFGPEVIQRLRTEAESAIRNHIQPSMAKVAKFLKDEYLPNTRPEIGISSLPDGVEMYNQCLKFHTSSKKYTAQIVHDVGLKEVQRIEQDMKKVFAEVGFEGTLKEFVNSLRVDPKFTFSTSQEMFDYFSDIVFKMIEPKLKDFFFDGPASPLEVVKTPANQTTAPSAYYITGTSDGKRPGKVFVNCNGANTRLKCSLISLALHEANPGHHYQNSYFLNLGEIPQFRKIMEDRNYSQAPSRFPINTAYGEGWALYCEKLGFEMGLYNDPYDRFGHYSEEMFRACRLVVDTGIHAFGWSREKAIKFMLDHTATPAEEIETEINRYIGWPGQAVGYKIGEIRLTELRRKAERELVEKFEIRQFHEVLLKSVGPLDDVEEEVDNYIKAMK